MAHQRMIRGYLYTTKWPFIRDPESREIMQDILCPGRMGGNKMSDAWDVYTTWLWIQIAIIVITVIPLIILPLLGIDELWVVGLILAFFDLTVIGSQTNNARVKYIYRKGLCYGRDPYLDYVDGE